LIVSAKRAPRGQVVAYLGDPDGLLVSVPVVVERVLDALDVVLVDVQVDNVKVTTKSAAF
jgi:hypothetical protein